MGEHADDQELYAAWRHAGSAAQAEAITKVWTDLYRIAAYALREKPEGDQLAQDCAQKALIKIHTHLDQCREPNHFLAWARQVLRNIVLDELNRPEHRRRAEMPDDDHPSWSAPPLVLREEVDLHQLLVAVVESAPLSDRSRRVVRGRYFQPRAHDNELAERETRLAGTRVSAANIQVTRAKNLAKIREDAELRERLRGLLDDQ